MQLDKDRDWMLPKPQVQEGVEYLIFPQLEATGVVNHLFSTRSGGVSEGHLSSMNLSFSRGDKEEYVRENYRRIAKVLNCESGDFVFSHQTHTNNVRIVTEKDRGKGLIREPDYQNIDGLVTKVPGLVLTTFFADCVPIFLVEPVNKIIGLCHSGWRGTVGRIGEKTIAKMESLGAKRKDIRAAIGPSICQECYEVSEDVAAQFAQEFRGHEDTLMKETKKGKYLLNLWKANQLVLSDSGILQAHLEVTNLCTCCNPEYLFSHRANRGMRGNLAAFLMLKKS